MERNQADQASLRETLRDEILALGAQLENIEESEVELETPFGATSGACRR